MGYNFLLSNEKWGIVGNKAKRLDATHEPYSRGRQLNHYVIGSDDKINVENELSEDYSLWYFQAPISFLGNQGISYGGVLQFTLSAFSGDFLKLNKNVCNIIYLLSMYVYVIISYISGCPSDIRMRSMCRSGRKGDNIKIPITQCTYIQRRYTNI